MATKKAVEYMTNLTCKRSTLLQVVLMEVGEHQLTTQHGDDVLSKRSRPNWRQFDNKLYQFDNKSRLTTHTRVLEIASHSNRFKLVHRNLKAVKNIITLFKYAGFMCCTSCEIEIENINSKIII